MSISSILSLLLTLLIGNSQDSKSTILNKKPTHEDNVKSINQWIERNFYIICLAFLVILMIVFIFVCFAICGISATDSGQYYNQLGGVI